MAEKKLTEIMAAKFNMERGAFVQALKETAVLTKPY